MSDKSQNSASIALRHIFSEVSQRALDKKKMQIFGMWFLNNLLRVTGYFIIAKLLDPEKFILYSIYFLLQDLFVLLVSNSSQLYLLNKSIRTPPRQMRTTVLAVENVLSILLGIVLLLIHLIVPILFESFAVLGLLILSVIIRLNVQFFSRVALLFVNMRQNLINDFWGNTIWFVPAAALIMLHDKAQLEHVLFVQIFVGILFLVFAHHTKIFWLKQGLALTSFKARFEGFFSFYRNTVLYAVLTVGFFSIEKLLFQDKFDDQKLAVAAYLLVSKMVFLVMHLTLGLLFSDTLNKVKQRKSGAPFLFDYHCRIAVIVFTSLVIALGYHLGAPYIIDVFPKQMTEDFVIFGFWIIALSAFYQMIIISNVYLESVFRHVYLYSILGAVYMGLLLTVYFAGSPIAYMQFITASLMISYVFTYSALHINKHIIRYPNSKTGNAR